MPPLRPPRCRFSREGADLDGERERRAVGLRVEPALQHRVALHARERAERGEIVETVPLVAVELLPRPPRASRSAAPPAPPPAARAGAGDRARAGSWMTCGWERERGAGWRLQ